MNDQSEPVYDNSDSDSFDVGTDIETQVCTEKFKESATQNLFQIPWIDRMDFQEDLPSSLIGTPKLSRTAL